MSLRNDFIPYTTEGGYISPFPVDPNTVRSCDNHPMFTSEYYIMLKRNNELIENDRVKFLLLITACVTPEGMLSRFPGDKGQEEADDYYGVLNACMQLGETYIPLLFLEATIWYFGFLNNGNPGKRDLDSFLIRQPQLLCAMISASFPDLKDPLHWLVRLLAFPLYVWTALVIATSCIGAPLTNTDDRRLSWHLVETVKPVSFLCWLASLIWYRRLRKDYGPTEMKKVASIYYQPQGNNPFMDHWVS